MNNDMPTRVVAAVGHGGQALSEKLFANSPDAAEREDVQPITQVLRNASVALTGDEETPFDYLFGGLATTWPHRHLPTDQPADVVAALKALGAAMVDQGPAGGANATVPPVYTYWGQFIDHDLTLNTNNDAELSILGDPFDPADPEAVADILGNARQPALNLDSLYGDGPAASGQPGAVPYVDGKRFLLGVLAETQPGGPVRTDPVPPALPTRDLPRVPPEDSTDERPTGTALIGDERNDENLIVAQLHTAFLHFHNEVVDWVERHEPQETDEETFLRARQLVRWHYQWLVVNDFLVTLVPRQALAETRRNPIFAPRAKGVYMPVEFSVAAFRFGHSMVRGGYDHNRNFGRSDGLPNTSASLTLLFQFTGKASPIFLGTGDTLPDNWPIEWDRFVLDSPAFPDRLARRIDTEIAPPLGSMVNEGNGAVAPPIRDLLKHLAQRNLLRGYKLGMPTGQAVAEVLGVAALTEEDLTSGDPGVAAALRDGGFLDATPLWFYILKEAELLGEGNQLGPVGGRIVAETIMGQIRHDPESFETEGKGWTPGEGVRSVDGEPIRTISDLLRFAGVMA